MQQINDEYFRFAAELGELEFNYNTIPARQEEVIKKIKALQKEGEQLQLEAQAEVDKARRQAEAVKTAEAKVAETGKQADAQPS
jgi:hypothetical protein